MSTGDVLIVLMFFPVLIHHILSCHQKRWTSWILKSQPHNIFIYTFESAISLHRLKKARGVLEDTCSEPEVLIQTRAELQASCNSLEMCCCKSMWTPFICQERQARVRFPHSCTLGDTVQRESKCGNNLKMKLLQLSWLTLPHSSPGHSHFSLMSRN